MAKTRTFVLLHGGDGWFKQVYAGNRSDRVQKVMNSYKRAGWSGNIYTTRARTLKEAVQKVGDRLDGEKSGTRHSG